MTYLIVTRSYNAWHAWKLLWGMGISQSRGWFSLRRVNLWRVDSFQVAMKGELRVSGPKAYSPRLIARLLLEAVTLLLICRTPSQFSRRRNSPRNPHEYCLRKISDLRLRINDPRKSVWTLFYFQVDTLEVLKIFCFSFWDNNL